MRERHDVGRLCNAVRGYEKVSLGFKWHETGAGTRWHLQEWPASQNNEDDAFLQKTISHFDSAFT